MGNFFNNIKSGVNRFASGVNRFANSAFGKVGSAIANPRGALLNLGRNVFNSVTKPSSPLNPPQPQQVQTQSQIAPIQNSQPAQIPSLAPIVPSQPQTVSPKPFTLDTTPGNITSDHLAGDATPSSVIASLPPSPYDQITQQYQQNVAPYNLATATQFSPNYIAAQNQVLDTNQGFRSGVQNIRGRAEPLDFQQGQEAALTRDTALQQQANAENMALQESIRQNEIASATAGRQQAQDLFTNQFNAIQGGLNYGIQAGQLGVSQYEANTAQQGVNQNRYEYQQITDPNTGFPTIQILDKQSGLPVGNVSPSSPMGQQVINSGQMITGGQNNGIINGYNITSYATDPNHEQAVNGWYNAINQAVQPVGGIVDANIAQQVINQLSPYSPVTGDMIMNSANKYGVDPTLMISLMQQDSQLGTKGLATKTFNPGNVGNTGSAIKNMGSWAKGVDSVAQWLSQHKTNGQVSQSGYQQVIAKAPAQLQSAIKPLPDGSAYIDSSLLARPEFGVMAQNFASQNGIRVLASSDATAINTVTQSVKNMQTLANTFGDLAPQSAGGSLWSNLSDPLSKLFDTNFGAQLKSYQANREGLFQQIRALAGSSPRLNTQELNTAANSMPTLDELHKNTLKDGINKLVKTQSYLDNAIRTFIPNYPGTPISIGGMFAVLGSDGRAYTFPSSDSALQFLKASR